LLHLFHITLSVSKKPPTGIDQPEGGYVLIRFYQQQAYIPSRILLKISH